MVLKGSAFKRSPEELELLYEKLLSVQPLLSKAVGNIMLVEAPNGMDIWVVCRGNDPQVQKALRWILMKAAERKLTFSQSQRYDFAIKGVTILRQMAD